MIRNVKYRPFMFEVRSAMREFWKEHSKDASMEEMMLDSNAEELCKDEVPEILSYLPNLQNKEVVELGAGIGRFTCLVAKQAERLTAVDFMDSFVQKNRELNGHYKNIEFKCKDVLELDIPDSSKDLVFSNWLYMYLDDDELQRLLRNTLLWLREGGFMFCRESCNHQSGNKSRSVNPSHYRKSEAYEHLFSSITLPTDDGGEYGFDLVLTRPIETYIKFKHNENQVVWLMQKVRRSCRQTHGFSTFQEFLDNSQYSRNGILRYEKIFGRNFVSTGGFDTTKEFVSMLNLKPGQKVLDVGCGIGGSAFYMVQNFGATVVGIDLSANMINIGRERAKEMGITSKDPVTFEVADATKREYPDGMFDVVYSRDTILHIADKHDLFRRFYRYLRPGGKVLISDYCCSDGDHSEHFKAYVKQRGYNLLSPIQYGQVLKDVGFIKVKAEDRTDLFVASLKKELARTESIQNNFVEEFSQEDYDYIVDGWKDKLHRTSQGDQRWGFFYAEKPLLIESCNN